MSKPRGRHFDINGIVVLNKPLHQSSNAALQKVKWLFQASKAGHTGALDPLATGVLPLCFGEATKYSQYLLDADKCYETDFCLGVRTSSGDVDGEVIGETDARDLTELRVREALTAFCGPIDQVPPMHSALKHQGQPLYKLARQGIEIERKARRVTIYSADVLAFTPGEKASLSVRIHCSKGTYIRSIADDLGQALGCGAHVTRLHRTLAGPFSAGQMVEQSELIAAFEDQAATSADQAAPWLLPVDSGIQHLPELELSDEQASELYFGRKITACEGVSEGLIRVILRGAFIGVALNEHGFLAPKRLMASKR